MSDSRYILLDVCWDESRFAFSLSEGSQLAWIKLICQVRRDCLQNSGGRAKRLDPLVASRKWGVGEESVVKMEAAAVEAGELVIEHGDWIVQDWARFQGKDAERKRRQRDKQASCGVTDTARTSTDGREGIGIGIGIVSKKGTSTKYPKKGFAKPTQVECEAFATELQIPTSEGEKFWNYWESVGWVRGKAMMKDWKASMRTWKLNYQERIQSGNGKKPSAAPRRTLNEVTLAQ